MKTLEQNLTEYGEALEDLHPSIEASELLVGWDTQASPQRPGPQRRPRPWVAVAAAALTLAIVGLIPLLTESPVEQRPQVSSLTWERVSLDPGVFGDLDSRVGVVSSGAGFVAFAEQAQGVPVWTSPDGINWSQAESDAPVFAGAIVTDVTVGGPGLVAVGEDELGAVVWTSTDGTLWSRVPDDEEELIGAWMTSVVEGGPGLVAVGFEDNGADVEQSPAVWTSNDGTTWTRVPAGTELGEGRMADVTAGDEGLVAVGHTSWHQGGTDAAIVWASADGLTWDRIPFDELTFGLADPFLLSVAAGRPGLVAGGGTGGPYSAIWASADGIVWNRLRDELYNTEEKLPGVVFEVGFVGSEFLVFGDDSLAIEKDGVGGSTWISRPSFWASTDGQGWRRTTFAGEGEIYDIATIDSIAVAVGRDGQGVAIWIGDE